MNTPLTGFRLAQSHRRKLALIARLNSVNKSAAIRRLIDAEYRRLTGKPALELETPTTRQ